MTQEEHIQIVLEYQSRPKHNRLFFPQLNKPLHQIKAALLAYEKYSRV